MSIASSSEFQLPELSIREAVQTFDAPGFPPSSHPAEADTFARHEGVPGHRQAALSDAHILVVGAGGLGGLTALGLVRSGVGRITIVEHDRFDRTNAPRQLMYADDLGQPKAIAVARNLLPHAPASAQITAIAMPFEAAAEEFPLSADLALFLVDNNRCRLRGAAFARARNIPAIFTMLGTDGMRVHAFLQGPAREDACIHCALPNLDPESVVPCAAAVISSCMLAASFGVFFAHRALMGWPAGIDAYNWREADLLGVVPDCTGAVQQRPNCPTCSSLR